MTRPRNTRDDIIPIPAIHGFSAPGAIEQQEAEGAAAMQRGDCEVIPAQISGGSEEELTALGFTLGPVDASDPLFRQAHLPPGWKRAGTGHSMHTDIVDDKGRKRISIFFKNAWYDRRADLSIVSVYGYVHACLYEEQTPVVDETWATRDAVLAALGEIRQEQQRRLGQWEGRPESYAVEYAAEAREDIARIDAFLAALADQAETRDGDQ